MKGAVFFNTILRKNSAKSKSGEYSRDIKFSESRRKGREDNEKYDKRKGE